MKASDIKWCLMWSYILLHGDFIPGSSKHHEWPLFFTRFFLFSKFTHLLAERPLIGVFYPGHIHTDGDDDDDGQGASTVTRKLPFSLCNTETVPHIKKQLCNELGCRNL